MRDYKKLRQKLLINTKHKLKASVNTDQLIIQATSTIEELDKAINVLAVKFREWYELYNPELSHSVKDHKKFVELALVDSSKSVMGAKLEKLDLQVLLSFAKNIDELFVKREKIVLYAEKKISKLMPNASIVGKPLIVAKLLVHAGSLERLALLPASTIQLFGAEKALFRHLHTKAKPPKHGLILQHPLLASAKRADRGRVARALADKLAIAFKIDFFGGDFIGDKLLKDLEEKFL
ncbi:NOP58 family protein [Candidatus Woesearchaeota archaeon]|nr:NOP58 family protein [Candidatus Woesearchaeota archaeon]